MTINDRVLKLDMDHLTQEDIDWLHRLKNLATVMQARLQLKHWEDNTDGQ